MKRLSLVGATLLVIAQSPAAHAAIYLSDYEIGVVRGVNSFGSPALDTPMRVVSEEWFVITAPLALGIASDPYGYSAPLLVLASEGLAYGAVSALKPIFHRARPYQTYPDLRLPVGPDPDGAYSFPSAHAAVSFAAATVIAGWRPSYALPAYLLAGVISYSRLYNAMHYPSDVLAGAAIGYGVGKLTRWGLDSLQGRFGFPTLEGQPGLNVGVGDGFNVGFTRRF